MQFFFVLKQTARIYFYDDWRSEIIEKEKEKKRHFR